MTIDFLNMLRIRIDISPKNIYKNYQQAYEKMLNIISH